MEEFIGFTKEFWQNQPTAFFGAGLAILLLGIYIKLLDIYQ